MKDKVKSLIEELKKDKKKSLIFGIGIVAVIAIIIITVVLLTGNSKEQTLKKYIEEMGLQFSQRINEKTKKIIYKFK